jgi:hypothetical protein
MRKTAIIITGNEKIIKSEPWSSLADSFYNDIKTYLEKLDFTVSFDPGRDFTVPATADAWLAHSKGIGRLGFAPEGTVTISIGSHRPGSINHPRDEALKKGGRLTKYHFLLTDEMRQEIYRVLKNSGLV